MKNHAELYASLWPSTRAEPTLKRGARREAVAR